MTGSLKSQKRCTGILSINQICLLDHIFVVKQETEELVGKKARETVNT